MTKAKKNKPVKTNVTVSPGTGNNGKVAIVQVDHEFLVALLKGTMGSFAGRFRVKEHGLPPDASFVSSFDMGGNVLGVVVHSDAFKRVEQGKQPPVLPAPVFEALRG